MTHVQKETAVLLKEKGFDLPCHTLIDTTQNPSKNIHSAGGGDWNSTKHYMSIPNIYEATEWLRAKGVHVQVIVTPAGWDYDLYNATNGKWLEEEGNPIYNYVKTHYLALEAGIVHALKNYVK